MQGTKWPSMAESDDAQVWLQEFAWTQSKQVELLCARNENSDSNQEIGRQPMFCFDTAMKSFYWSGLVYDTDQVIPAVLPLAQLPCLYTIFAFCI